jgi:hypothetical protein
MSVTLIDTNELQQMMQQVIQPLHEKIDTLRAIIETDGKPLTVKQFASRSGYSVTTVRGFIDNNLISYNQTKERGKITIPATELIKVKQFQGE